MIKAKVICDSICVSGVRLTTFVLTYPRFIHSEVLTHRMFSRNASSSRAIPVKKQIRMVWDNPVLPIAFQANKPGMQAGEAFGPFKQWLCRMVWYGACYSAIGFAYLMERLNVSKQYANRILEPFSTITVVCSATDYANFFALRYHPDAQPEICELAKQMYNLYVRHEPEYLFEGDWHLPFITREDRYDSTVDDLIKMSVARCARVSYLNHDQTQPSKDKDFALYDRLVGSTPKHCFDSTTEVLTSQGFVPWTDVTEATCLAVVDQKSGAFIGFERPIEVMAYEYDGFFYEYLGKGYSLKITAGHNIYGHRVRVNADRFNPLNLQLFAANSLNSNKARYITAGESAIRMTISAARQKIIRNDDFYIGCLYGFFIGDGHAAKDCRNKIKFHLKKKRKIEYLKHICLKLGLPLSMDIKNATYTITDLDIAKKFRRLFYNSNKEKTIPYDFFIQKTIIHGLFDGLKNSDGSSKRKTWVYSTTSAELAKRVQELGALYGYPCTPSYTESPRCRSNILIRLNFATNGEILVNDSRKPNDRVQIRRSKEFVYCATVSGGVLIVRRDGKILLSGNCSPTEHQAKAISEKVTRSGNFLGWLQYRQTLPNQNITEFKR